MVPCRSGYETLLTLILVQMRQKVYASAHLERAHGMMILMLETHLRADITVQCRDTISTESG